MKQLSFLTFIAFLLCCTTQINTETQDLSDKSTSIGKTVKDLDSSIWALFQDRKGNYWFGSNGKGVFHYDGKVLKAFTTEDGLVSNTVRGFKEDKDGNIFIETQAGISKFDGQSFQTLQLTLDATNNWKLAANDLWFNCNGSPKDIYRYDGKNLYQLELPRKDLDKAFGIKEIELNENPYAVYGINKDNNGNLWIGTVLAGAFRFDGHSFLWIGEKELTQLEDGRVPGVRSMIEDKDGFMWLSNVLHKYQINQDFSYNKLTGIDFSKAEKKMELPYFNAAVLDNNQDLWMITYGSGVWHYDGKSINNFPIENDESTVLLITIYKDSQGTLWLGSDNDGAYKFNGKSFEKFKP